MGSPSVVRGSADKGAVCASGEIGPLALAAVFSGVPQSRQKRASDGLGALQLGQIKAILFLIREKIGGLAIPCGGRFRERQLCRQ